MIPKFRAWLRKKKNMIKVSGLDFIDNSIVVTVGATPLYSGDKYVAGSICDDVACDLMQSTGLNDKNGVEIFEGDILREEAPRGNKYLVQSFKGGFAVNMFQDELSNTVFPEPLAELQMISYIENSCEIIGNQYTHPELLEATK